jgi:hypothetical protein
MPTWAYGDEVSWPGTWAHETASHSLTPLTPGTAEGHIRVARTGVYELWLLGGFSRGFEVSVDGSKVGTLRNLLSGFGAWSRVANVPLSAGVHAFAYTYPASGLGPGSAENEYTALSGVILQPQSPRGELVTLAPAQAESLCARAVQWIEIVKPA